MYTNGVFLPGTKSEAKENYQELGPTAQMTVKEVAKAMEFDNEEYTTRITEDVIETARDVLFASLLKVTVGTKTEFESWKSQNTTSVEQIGSENVDHVVWHAPPFAETGVAATFQNRETAAIATLRRQAFGRIYRKLFTE